MRNPNGYGSVVKLSGNRRRPYLVRKTQGFDDRGYPVYEIIGYTATREEGMILLAEYNKSPWNIENRNLTLSELYALWNEKRRPLLGRANQASLSSAFSYCKEIADTPYAQLNAYPMQECINHCGKGYATQANIRNLFVHLDRLALEMDIITVSRSELLSTSPIPPTNRRTFTEEELSHIWTVAELPWVDSILFMLYSGFRISEMLQLRSSNIYWKEKYMVGGLKTTAGKNRVVPIHSLLHSIIERRLQEDSVYLFSLDGHACCLSQYYVIWHRFMKEWQYSHTPHECRHTFRSRLDSAGANKVAIDRLMGHRSADVGERIYTHKILEELRANLELVTH